MLVLNTFDVIQAVALRLFLVFIGVGNVLRSRMEVAAPGLSIDSLSNAAYLHNAGTLHYTQHSSLAPSLLVWITRVSGGGLLAAAILSTLADVIGAVALQHLFLQQQPKEDRNAGQCSAVGAMYLWSPLTIAAAVSGSAAPLYCAAVLGAAAAAGGGKPLLAAISLAFATHLAGPQTILIALPLVCMLLNRKQGSSKAPGGAVIATILFLGAFCAASAAMAIAGDVLLGRSLQAAAWDIPRKSIGTFSGILGLERDTSLRNPLGWLGVGAEPAASDIPISNLSSSSSSFAAAAGYREDRWATIEPNLGLQWYLFAEVFPQFRQLFRYCFAAISAALAMAVGIRFSRRPVLALCAQGAVFCMLAQHPTYSDLALWLGLLPLLTQELEALPKWVQPCLAGGLAVCLAMNTAAYQMWLSLGSGNANFFYGMNLLWAGWQAVALVQLLKAGAKADILPSTAAPPTLRNGALKED